MNKKLSPERRELIAALNAADRPLSPASLARALGKDREATKRLLYACVRDGQALATDTGGYEAAALYQHVTYGAADFEHEQRFSGADSPHSGTEKPGREPGAGTKQEPTGTAKPLVGDVEGGEGTVEAEKPIDTPHSPNVFYAYWHGDGSNPRTVALVYDEYGRLVPDLDS